MVKGHVSDGMALCAQVLVWVEGGAHARVGGARLDKAWPGETRVEVSVESGAGVSVCVRCGCSVCLRVYSCVLLDLISSFSLSRRCPCRMAVVPSVWGGVKRSPPCLCPPSCLGEWQGYGPPLS